METFMRFLKSLIILLSVLLIIPIVDLASAQHLPEGMYHETRARTIDIVHYKAELQLDMPNGKVSGVATVACIPLRKIDNFSLDAIRLNVDEVKLINNSSPQVLNFTQENNSLKIELGRDFTPQETLTVAIRYSCQPNAGIYFQKDMDHTDQYFVHSYGEGGLLANWLPIYNDVNDKFSTEMVITVPAPYTVVSNGKLVDTQKSGGQQTFHWKQTLPHSNYLISVYAGIFEKGELPPALGTIPVDYWVPKGHLQEGSYAFRNTTKMVEFFSRRFDYVYPWDKYDQVAVPDYAIGAMEHTGVTGVRSSVLRDASAPDDFGSPHFDAYRDFWTADELIAHELAHHWFGDNLTCSNLSYIWLNESFASYCQMLWDEESLGRESLLIERQIALDHYLAYVADEHIIRPLEYHYFDMPDDIYNEEHTYMKGGIVLHMLRGILGDDAFFRAMHYYLKKNEFKNVESNDLMIALEESTGQNLDWFFNDWVVGGGHPIFEVSYSYISDLKLIDLDVKQVQPIVKGQDLFKLPVTIMVATASGEAKHKIWVEHSEDKFVFGSETEPLMVSFDGEGNLVAELRFTKEIDELLYQTRHDQLPGQIWALRQLVERFPSRAETAGIISEILGGDAFWGLKAEAVMKSGSLRTPAAAEVVTSALQNPDYRIRKAAVLAIADFGGSDAIEALTDVINHDPHTDVVGTAIVVLAKIDPEVKIDFIRSQIGRPSWYSEITIACMDALSILGKENLLSEIKPFSAEGYNQELRMAALEAWASCAPGDLELHKTLMQYIMKPPYQVQLLAIKMLGQLRVVQAKQLLEKMAGEWGDLNLTVLAKKALEEINRVEKSAK
jgi:aminopeptidase N